jgi:hypothetical protein
VVDLLTTWTADTVPAGAKVYPPSVLLPYVTRDGPIWTLTPDLVLLRDSTPVAQAHPPGGTRWIVGSVWVDPAGRVVVGLVVELPDGRRFVAEGEYRATRFGEATKDKA